MWATSSEKSAFKYAHNAQIQIILRMQKNIIRALALHSYILQYVFILLANREDPV